jgi:hypothetical protein
MSLAVGHSRFERPLFMNSYNLNICEPLKIVNIILYMPELAV